MLNFKLLDKTLAYIKKHPENWDQRDWHCGSVGCFAYWAVRLSHSPVQFVSYDPQENRMLPTKNDELDEYYGPVTTIQLRARRLLGLSDVEAEELFSSSNELSDLEMLTERIKEAHRER